MPSRKRVPRDYFVCPHCGARVPVGAASCRECGSDDETGWSGDAEIGGLDLPTGYGSRDDDDEDYDDFVQKEFPGRADLSPGRSSRVWSLRIVVILVCLALLLLLMR